MTRYEKFKMNLWEFLGKQEKLLEGEPFRSLASKKNHEDTIDFMLISIAGSLCLIADALNPEAARVEEEPWKSTED